MGSAAVAADRYRMVMWPYEGFAAGRLPRCVR
jgi:hypothetical protein